MTYQKGTTHRSFALSAMAAGVAVAFGTMAPATASAQDEEATELGTLQITGSRIKRSDIEGALPVTVIDRTQIEMSGNITVGDLLRNTSFNSFGSFRQQSGSSAQGLVSLDLRGLGSSRTLVLIDGRRAPKAPMAPTAQDLNAIPLAAIERIEILQDGASAIYGSDALGGVVNVILRKDYDGFEISGQKTVTSRIGGNGEQAQILAGTTGKRGSFIVGLSHQSQDIVFARDSLYNTPGASFFSNNYNEYGDPNTSADDQFSFLPGGCNDGPGVNTGAGYYIVPYTGADNVNGQRCAYDFTLVSADEAAIENQSIFTKGTFEINADWSVNTMASVARVGSFGRYAPTPGFFFVPGSVMSQNTGGQVTGDSYVYHRFAAVGPRDTSTESNVYDLITEFQGRLGQVDLSVGARINEYKYVELGKNYVVRPLAEQFAADGSYDFVNPLNNPASVLQAMAATINRESVWKTEELFGEFSMPLFDIGGGTVQLAAGAEYRKETYADQYDSLQEAGVILGSAGNSAGGDRNVKGAYVETLWPITEQVELTGALRYDEYSDYGSDLSPKLSVRYQPLDELTLRASFGQGFRAPTLDILTQKTSFSAESINNHEATCTNAGGNWNGATCDIQVQVDTFIRANPDLESEQSDQFAFGAAWAPFDWFDMTADYWNVAIDNRILYFDPTEIIDRGVAGDPVPAGLGLTLGASGEIDRVDAGYGNEGKVEVDGIDLAFNSRFNMGALGNVTSTLAGAYYLSYKEDGGRNQIGDDEVPQMRWNWNNSWVMGPMSAAWNINYIDSQAQTVTAGGVKSGHIPSYTTHDLQFNYNLPWNGTVTVGVLNALDKEPDPRSAFDGRNYNFYLYDQNGRTPYLKLTQRFN